MKRIATIVGILALGGSGPVLAQDYGGSHIEPVYVGSRVCGECHSGTASAHQYSQWLMSPHAQAYASLWTSEAKEIAVLSGIPDEPQESLICLGCHATAWDTEAWERDPTFVLEDGVQCERCHGPGSEYSAAEIMMDSEKAMRYGLRYPAPDECTKCHGEKGSHVAVLGPSGFEIEEWKRRLFHGREPGGRASFAPRTDLRVTESSATNGGPHYVGVQVCVRCHKGPRMGFQHSRWRLGLHARAYAVLSTPTAYEMAKEAGVEGDPQRSETCLECHATGRGEDERGFLPGFDHSNGVQCESCHGAGSDYANPATMRNREAAMQAGMKFPTEDDCAKCHNGYHGADFDYDASLATIAHPLKLEVADTGPRYKTPLHVAVTADGKELWVACEAANAVIVVDLASRRAVAEIPTGGQATDVTFTPAGDRAFVSNRLDDTVTVVDVASRAVLETFEVGDEPHGVLFDHPGENLYVLNTAADCISIIDPDTLEERRRLPASRNPWSLTISPDGRRIAVTNTVPAIPPFRETAYSEVTMIDATRGRIESRILVPDTNLCQGIDWHPSGKFFAFTMDRTKNLVPMTRLLQGWTITNGLAVVWDDGRVDQVLLDEPDECFPDPTDVAFSPDGRWGFVTSSGADRLAVVDVPKLVEMLESASDYEREHVLPNHLGKPTEFVVKHISTGISPRGVTFDPDGRLAYVANAYDDSVTVIDVEKLEAVDTIDLGGPEEITKVRWGERLFHSADITFRRQFSCHTCHPDGNVDGITYDIEPDGIGMAPVDNRTLRGILDTDPFKWEGTNPSLARQCGPRLAVFFTRIDPYTPEELDALTTYICTIPRPPNRHRPLGADLTPAQRRGKRIFERTHTNSGDLIPEGNRCVTCHFPPLYTDRLRHDVGNLMPYDHDSVFDTPHLNNIYDTAPYLHNGIAPTLEEIWTEFNPEDEHGVTNDMTKDQLNDLIEFLKTL